MKKYFVISLILTVTFSNSLFGWGSLTHKKMTSDAYFIMPQVFREFLGAKPGSSNPNPNLKALLAASIEPDTVLKDFKNHVFHIHGYDMGNGPFNIENLAKEIADDIRAKAPLSQIIQKLGWISHYVADLTQPLHTGVATWEGIEEKNFHAAYEKEVDKRIYSFGVLFDGAFYTQRLSARMIYEALWANQFYSTIESAYTNANDYEKVRDLTAKCYSRAVNNIVDVWYSIWVMAGGKVNPRQDTKPKYFPPYWRKNLSHPGEIKP